MKELFLRIKQGASGMNTIAFNLSVLPEANTYYFDDIKWELEEKGNTIPLTPEEKKDTLTWALDNWVKGMMEQQVAMLQLGIWQMKQFLE